VEKIDAEAMLRWDMMRPGMLASGLAWRWAWIQTNTTSDSPAGMSMKKNCFAIVHCSPKTNRFAARRRRVVLKGSRRLNFPMSEVTANWPIPCCLPGKETKMRMKLREHMDRIV